MFVRGEMFADASGEVSGGFINIRRGACAHAKRWLENYNSGIKFYSRYVDPFAFILRTITLPKH